MGHSLCFVHIIFVIIGSQCSFYLIFPLSLVIIAVFIPPHSDLTSFYLHLWCISRSLLLGGAGSPLLPLQSASYLPARHHSEHDSPQNVKWPPSALHIDPLLKLNISNGTMDQGDDCFNQSNILKNQATYPEAMQPLSHHLITPDIAISVPKLCAHKTIMLCRNKSMLIY